jgi:hypothetical protein
MYLLLMSFSLMFSGFLLPGSWWRNLSWRWKHL